MRLGTRGSALALAQARLVQGWLGGGELVVVRTRGDVLHDPLKGEGNGLARRTPRDDKSRWVAELEQALLSEEIDLAVHSAKDIPVELTDGLELLGSPNRASAEDALIGARSLEELPEGACVGTSSVRRAAQLRAARADLEVVSLRGNIDTRLRKLATAVTASGDGSGGGESSLHAIVLAKAGLSRLGRERDIGCSLDAARFVPAPGQGALALQARAGDERARQAVETILDRDASACLAAERALAGALGASCNTPLGAHAVPAGCGCLHLRAWIGLPDGAEWIGDDLLGGFYDPEELGQRLAERLVAVGARELLRRAEEMAVEPG
ncbi:MAG TPA: hydroxymethylbilane synthase [Solirubrobacteraceae bacterium]|jgi:hydroxymethylbilane synthase|nr:hydroxymethylbilane synthase [Solirubrobacteraceae bacterium]